MYIFIFLKEFSYVSEIFKKILFILNFWSVVYM